MTYPTSSTAATGSSTYPAGLSTSFEVSAAANAHTMQASAPVSSTAPGRSTARSRGHQIRAVSAMPSTRTPRPRNAMGVAMREV